MNAKEGLIKSLTVLIVCYLILPALSVYAQIENKSQWDDKFQEYYRNGDPILDVTNANDEGLFSWRAHYWIRAYITMAETYRDSTYLDKAVKLIDFVLYYRDDVRHARGEIDIQNEPYDDAPLYYLNNRDEATPCWRRWESGRGWRVLIVENGQITHAIMRFVDLVYNNPQYLAYQPKANEYTARIEETVQAFDSNFVVDRFPEIPGSYYYPNPDGSGLYSGAVEFNMNATMGVSLLLLDKVRGGVPAHRQKAEAILEYFKKHVRHIANDAYDWDYHPQKPWIQTTATSSQDLNHAHLDLSFLILAYHRQLNLNEQDMQKFANTLTKNVYLGNGELAWSVDGSDTGTQKYWPVGFDWIDLALFDHNVLAIAKEVYNINYPSPTWARPFLGWAEILKWTKTLEVGIDTISPTPPKNLRARQLDLNQ